MSWRRGKTSHIDIVLGQAPSQDVGAQIVRQLGVKGFCVIDTRLNEQLTRRAVHEADILHAEGWFHGLHPLLSDGLLGEEGSSLVMETSTFEVEESLRRAGDEILGSVEHTLMDYGHARIEPHISSLGFELVSRSPVILHKMGTPIFPEPELEHAEATRWLEIFVRHKVMSVLFLGPGSGRLDLAPHDTEDAETHTVQTSPGMMVVIRPDLLSHRWTSSDDSLAMSVFALGGADNPRQARRRRSLVPTCRELDGWMMQRMAEFKAQEIAAMLAGRSLESAASSVPSSWRKAMNQICPTRQMVAVRGVACRFPCGYFFDGWFQASFWGPDYATEVPHFRWDHGEVYSDDPDGWRQNKSYCRHAAFLDDIGTFDCAMFSLPIEEARALDPHQRLMLEVGYSAFYELGYRLDSLRKRHCAVYAGCGNNEWMLKERAAGKKLPRARGAPPSQGVGAGRFAFTLGLQGPSLTVDTEGSSGMAALYMAAEVVEDRRSNYCIDQAVALAAHLCLSPLFWPSHCQSGWLCAKGRCFTFDSSAGGYIRGEGCCAAVVETSDQGGEKAEDVPCIGHIAGGMMNSNGPGASLATPSGPAEQEVIAGAIRNARMSPLDIDCVETHGSGAILADAVEVSSHVRAHRGVLEEDSRDVAPLHLGALKTSVGNQIECGSLTGFIKTLFAARWGLMTSSLHLRQVNLHVELAECPALFSTESHEFPEQNPIIGTLSRGFGGSNVYMVARGHPSEERTPWPKVYSAQDTLAFWPGGGGALGSNMRPEKAYTIVGTWSRWQDPERMEFEGGGTYGFLVTLGENRWEQFQIWLDYDSKRILHPGQLKGPKDTRVYGPEEPDADLRGFNWIIDGRPKYAPSEAGQALAEGSEVEALDTGQPGDEYHVRLRVAGRWRSVTWEKLPRSEAADVKSVPFATDAKYYIVSNESDWSNMVEMTRDADDSHVFFSQVVLHRDLVEFQILRNKDWLQVLYPATRPAEPEGKVVGPDDEGSGMNWSLEGTTGDVYVVRFERRVESGVDLKKVSWKFCGRDDQAALPAAPRYCIEGSWDHFQEAHDLTWADDHYEWTVVLGADGEESFHILKDGNHNEALFPNVNHATPHKFHALKGPARNLHGLVWTIGRHKLDEGEPGARYKVELLMKEDGTTPKKLQWSKLAALPQLMDQDTAS